MSTLVRNLVSKKKRRFNEDGYDLDLTYITDNLVAMGYPAENVEGMYRNSMAEVVRFLDSRHAGKYKVYNLCSERSYDKSKFHGRVAHYPFQDHNAPPIELMRPFCDDVQEWLGRDPKNVAVVHCKAGKGRTGVMLCAYLLHCGMWQTARDSLAFYGAARTKNSKGVTIPSQARYVHYYQMMLANGVAYSAGSPPTLFLSHITMHTVPRFGGRDVPSCSPVFAIKMRNVKVYQSKAVNVEVTPKQQTDFQLALPRAVPVCGDVKIEFYHKQALSREKMFHFWFNTAFVTSPILSLAKEELDKAHKDKSCKIFSADFSIQLHFKDSALMSAPSETGVGNSIAAGGSKTADYDAQQRLNSVPAPPPATSPFPPVILPASTSQTSLSVNGSGAVTVDDDEEDSFEHDVGDEEEDEGE